MNGGVRPSRGLYRSQNTKNIPKTARIDILASGGLRNRCPGVCVCVLLQYFAVLASATFDC